MHGRVTRLTLTLRGAFGMSCIQVRNRKLAMRLIMSEEPSHLENILLPYPPVSYDLRLFV